jgi:outer membrane protein assembly factor BamD
LGYHLTRIREKPGELIYIMIFISFWASCGGPYKAKRIRLPGDKLTVADRYFNQGDYHKAEVEYKDFLASFAGDERSDYAQFRLAESYRNNEEYSLAAVEYRILITDYGYSEYVDDAFFLEGVCYYKEAPRPERDQIKTYTALGKINRFLKMFPDSPRQEEALKLRLNIYRHLGEKEFMNAKLYFSKEEYEAALVYLDKVIENYPGTRWEKKSLYYKALIMEKRGDHEESVKLYRQALSSPGIQFEEENDARSRLQSLIEVESGS